jgi:hypothetical protein
MMFLVHEMAELFWFKKAALKTLIPEHFLPSSVITARKLLIVNLDGSMKK